MQQNLKFNHIIKNNEQYWQEIKMICISLSNNLLIKLLNNYKYKYEEYQIFLLTLIIFYFLNL
jgi:hypothetical protein